MGSVMRELALDLGDVTLVSGHVLQSAVLCYATFGALNASADNAILIPSYYTGTHRSYGRMIGPGRALDPERHFIIIADMFGNGVSTSPSHRPPGEARTTFPRLSIADNVACQRRLITSLGVSTLRLVTGWSMGAMQSLWWGALYPEAVQSVLAVCGSASCWPLNQVFLDGVCAALRADQAFDAEPAVHPPTRGLKAFARTYAGWAYSAQFYRDKLYKGLGFSSLESFLEAWEAEHVAWSAHDLLAMADTWRTADIGLLAADGTAEAALSMIRAPTLIMPCDTDAYFTVEECRLEAAAIPRAEVRVLNSPYGHCAGAPGRFPEESDRIDDAIRELLA